MMMSLVGGRRLPTSLFVHGPLREYMQVATNTDVDESYCRLFQIATAWVWARLAKDQLKAKEILTVFLVRGPFCLKMDPGIPGVALRVACYDLDQLDALRHETAKVVVILEELVHHLWDEWDEDRVKQTVCGLIPPECQVQYVDGQYVIG